jgi:hypothetical protein
LLLFGGATEGRDESSYSNDLCAFSLDANKWDRILPTVEGTIFLSLNLLWKILTENVNVGAAWPTHRHGHSCIALNPFQMLLFGGRDKMNPARFQNDLWIFDSNQNQWTEIRTTDPKPEGLLFFLLPILFILSEEIRPDS